MLTADIQDDVRRTVIAAGANGFLTKPLQRPELMHALHAFVQAKGFGRAG
jgi:CheY-like chemotaxis protein